METKFTKGEWKVSTIGYNNGVGHVVADIEDYEHEICTLYRGGEENIANAKLIAAAPELLQALLYGHEISSNIQYPTNEELKMFTRMAALAIKKATE